MRIMANDMVEDGLGHVATCGELRELLLENDGIDSSFSRFPTYFELWCFVFVSLPSMTNERSCFSVDEAACVST